MQRGEVRRLGMWEALTWTVEVSVLFLFGLGCSDDSNNGKGSSAKPRGETTDAASDGAGDAGPPWTPPPTTVTFERITLTTAFYAEGAAVGDFDRDGVNDVVSGPFWYAGPDFAEKHTIYPDVTFDPLQYSDNFFAFVYDFNGDTWPDVLFIGFPGQDASWYENPAASDAGALWVRHLVFNGVDDESPTFMDITGDGVPELVCAYAGQLGWASFDMADATKPWVFHAASTPGDYANFTHGLGVGDLNGDGRLDILERGGAWLAPSVTSADPWQLVSQDFGPGGAQMFAYDVDADGDTDVVSTWAAHLYGVAWFERGSSITEPFSMHEIAPITPPLDGGTGIVIHEPHAMDLADINDDGLKDVVTGERFWGHVPEVRDPMEPASIYWFELARPPQGAPIFVPHLIDDASGVGTQVVATDVDGDARLDVVTANKKGAFVFLQR